MAQGIRKLNDTNSIPQARLFFSQLKLPVFFEQFDVFFDIVIPLAYRFLEGFRSGEIRCFGFLCNEWVEFRYISRKIIPEDFCIALENFHGEIRASDMSIIRAP